MGMKIWELHGLHFNGAIRSTPDGEADVAGLILSEKAYLLAVRDFRPAELVGLVEERGPDGAARALIAHYAGTESLHATVGRGLVATRGQGGLPAVRRGDEAPAPASARR